MLKRWDWALLVLVVIGIYFRFIHQTVENAPTAVVEPMPLNGERPETTRLKDLSKTSKEKLSPKTPTPATSPPPQISETKLSDATPTPKQPGRSLVEFEVKEGGLAVAFGDIVLGKVATEAKKGLAQAQRSRLWESAEIPYTIDKGIQNPAPILEAIKIFTEETTVRFVPYSGQKDSVVFVPTESLCASYLGRSGGHQPIYISPQCGANEVMHELMHALGFVHEHSRTDRDTYVEVVWQNIDPQYWLQFWMVPDEQVHEYVGSVFSFDPESIMLYDSTAFAKVPGTVTLKSKTGSELKPSRKAFSRIDKERLHYLYGS